MKFFKIDHSNSFLLFQIMKYAALILISIALAKSYLSLADLGKYENFIFLSSTVSFFWVTGLMQTLLSHPDANNKTRKDGATIFFSSFVLLLILSIISAALIFMAFNIRSIEAFCGFNSDDKLLLLLYLMLNPSGFLIEYLLLLKKLYKKLVLFGIMSVLVPLIIIPLPAFFGLEVSFCFYGLVAWSVIKLLILMYLLLKHSTIKINKKEISDLFTEALPLIGTTLVVGSAAYVDGIIITTNYDAATFAVFRFGAREFPLFMLIAASFSTSLIPMISVSKNISSELDNIKNKSKQMIYSLFPVAIVLMLTSQFLFPLVFNPDFKESYKIFDVYLLLVISRFVFPQSILMGMKEHKTIFFVSIIELVINISSSLLFIYYFGFIGVAFGTVVAYFFEKYLLVLFIRKKHYIKGNKYIPTAELMIISISFLLIFILKSILII
ncbi:MAG: oligosaccharide flippase family protein [Bacteroidales bacterium]|nr:oligosaccharide flippase family protein [Bacteroidales bacterium]